MPSDVETGTIYVLKNLTTNPDMLNLIKNRYHGELYKIGYTSGSVDERIRNAENEATYLCSPVEKVGAFKCYNINNRKLETLLHHFFGEA